ncbi:MAG: hypothetical protein ACK5HT_10410 [Draconibacterium sp.]
MKKKGILLTFAIASYVVLNLIALSAKTAHASSDLEKKAAVEEKARNVWCQILGDRQGCRNDNSRSCDNTVFCE